MFINLIAKTVLLSEERHHRERQLSGKHPSGFRRVWNVNRSGRDHEGQCLTILRGQKCRKLSWNWLILFISHDLSGLNGFLILTNPKKSFQTFLKGHLMSKPLTGRIDKFNWIESKLPAYYYTWRNWFQKNSFMSPCMTRSSLGGRHFFLARRQWPENNGILFWTNKCSAARD